MESNVFRLTHDYDGFFERDIPFFINQYAYDHYEQLMMHTHDFIEIAYVCKGRGLHVIGNKRQTVSRGDLCIINVDTAHCFYPMDEQNSTGFTVFNCMFLPQFIQNVNINPETMKKIINIFLYKSIYSSELELAPDLKLSGKMMMKIESIYNEMFEEYQQKSEDYEDVLKILLCKLLIMIYRSYRKPKANSPDLYRQKLIYDSIEFLKQNYSQKLNLDDISQHFFLSRCYFATLFKKITGKSVFDYIQHIRIEEACRLLLETDQKITDIALSVGYANYRFFNKTFKKLVGMTALEYRKSQNVIRQI